MLIYLLLGHGQLKPIKNELYPENSSHQCFNPPDLNRELTNGVGGKTAVQALHATKKSL